MRKIQVPADIIDTLYSWHGGQWSPLYSLASTGEGTPEMIDKGWAELHASTRDMSHLDSKDETDVIYALLVLGELTSDCTDADYPNE